MNLDQLWRQPLQSPQTNKAVTQTAFEAAKSVVKTAVDYRVLDENASDTYSADAGVFDHSDISSLASVYRYDFRSLLSSTKHRKAPRLVNLLRFCEVEAKELGLNIETQGRLYQRSQRMREIIHTIEELIIYRNYLAHHTYERNDLGLCFKVSSTLLRYAELLDLPSSWAEDIEIIRSSSIKTLAHLFEADPTNELRQGSSVEISRFEQQPGLNEILSRLDSISGSIGSIIELRKPATSNHEISTENTGESEVGVEELDGSIYDGISEPLTLTQLRQKLLEIRKDISTGFKLKSDSDNILSANVIDEIILLGIDKLSDWKKLPTTSKLQVKKKRLCGKQLDLHWENIEEILQRMNWEKNR